MSSLFTPKEQLQWSEALRRLSLLISGSWFVEFIGMPNGPGTNYDFKVRLVNILSVERVHASGPDLALTIKRAIDKAAKRDATFQEIERQIAHLHQETHA